MTTKRGISRREFLRASLGTAAATILAACVPVPQPTLQAPKPTAAEPTSATVATKAPAVISQRSTLNFMTSSAGDPTSRKYFGDALDQFKSTQPNITVELEFASSADRAKKIVAGVAAKKAPHVVPLASSEISNYAKLGFLAPVDDLIQQTGGEQAWQPTSFDAAVWNGARYAVPYNGGNYRMLWYRSDLFREKGLKLPTNTDEWKAVAEKLMLDTNSDGKLDVYGTVLAGGTNRWTLITYMTFLWQQGETVFDKNLDVIFGGPGAVKALEFYRDMIKFGPPAFATYSYNETIDAFVAGKAATQLYAGRTVGAVYDNAKGLLDATHGIKLPSGPIGGEVGRAGWDYYGIFNEKVGVSTDEQQAAKEFLKFLLTGKPATDYALTSPGHLIPPYKATLNDPNLWNGHPIMKSHKEEIDWLFNTSNSLDLTTEAGAVITSAKVTAGVLNPYWAVVENANVIPIMVQKVIVEGQDPKASVSGAVQEMKRLVADRKSKP